jgi:hypothetical protein
VRDSAGACPTTKIQLPQSRSVPVRGHVLASIADSMAERVHSEHIRRVLWGSARHALERNRVSLPVEAVYGGSLSTVEQSGCPPEARRLARVLQFRDRCILVGTSSPRPSSSERGKAFRSRPRRTLYPELPVPLLWRVPLLGIPAAEA